MITVTEKARVKILELLAREQKAGLALRMGIRGRGPGGFVYELRFVPAEERTSDDTVVEADGITIVVDPESAPHLGGAAIDFYEDLHQSGFKIDNPNSLWTDPLALAVQQVLDGRINPAIAAHGGYVSLLGVKDGTAFIQMGGGCQGCGMADVTLKQGVEVMIREAVPEVLAVVDTTDHASGANPYYRPAKGGQSPLAG
jgi:Fe/S biogenesis protein NfuA